ATSGVNDVVGAAGHGAPRPRIVNVDVERTVHANGRMEARRGLPRSVSNPADELAVRSGGTKRYFPTVAQHLVALFDEAVDAHLQTLDRGVDEAGLPRRYRLLAEHRPRLERPAHLQQHRIEPDFPKVRVPELEVRREPGAVEPVTPVGKLRQHTLEVL